MAMPELKPELTTPTIEQKGSQAPPIPKTDAFTGMPNLLVQADARRQLGELNVGEPVVVENANINAAPDYGSKMGDLDRAFQNGRITYDQFEEQAAAIAKEYGVKTADQTELPGMSREFLLKLEELQNQSEPGPLPVAWLQVMSRRKFLISAATGLAGLALAACGVQPPPTGEATSAPTVPPTERPLPSVVIAPKPSATPAGILAMPTQEAVGGGSVPDIAGRQALYVHANQELVTKIPGITSAKAVAQFEGPQYQAIGEASAVTDGVSKNINFLIKPDGSILILGNKVNQLDWSFDASGTAVWKDKPGNLFGKVIQATDLKDWSVAVSDFGIVGSGGLQLVGAGFSEGQPLVVQNVVIDANGKVISLEVQVSPGNWQKVSDKLASQINLTDQAKRDAKVLPTPTPEPTKIPQAPPERHFVTLMGTTDYATFALGGTGSITEKMFGWRTDGSQGATGIKTISVFFHTNVPVGIGSVEPPTKDELNLELAGKPVPTARFQPDTAYFLKVKSSHILANGKFDIIFVDDKNRTIKVLMSNNEVWTNVGLLYFYIVPGEKAGPGLVRLGDVAGLSNATEIKNAIDSGKEEIDWTNRSNDPNAALIVISMEYL